MSYIVKRLITTDDIKDGAITLDKIAPDTIVIRAFTTFPDSLAAINLSATATGVKWTSNFKFKWTKQNLKKVVIRASWTATATDSVEKICVKDITSGNDVVCVEGNAGTDQENSTTDLSNVTDEGLFTVYTAVTTASATTTATYSIVYVVVELVYGAS